MSRATDAAGSPAAPGGASFRRGALCESDRLTSETARSNQDADRSLESHAECVLAAPGDVVGGQPAQHGDLVVEDVGCPNGRREGNSRATGRRRPSIRSGSRSPSPSPRLCYYSLRTTTESPKQKEAASAGAFELLQHQRLPPPAISAQQQHSTCEKVGEGVHSVGSQTRSIIKGMKLTHSKEECGDVISEDARSSTEALTLKSTIPSVLITSPSLGRISVLCAPDTPRSAQVEYTAQTCDMSSRPTQDEEEAARAFQPVVPAVEGEKVCSLQVNVNPSFAEAPPQASPSTTSWGDRLCLSNTAEEREHEGEELDTEGTKDAIRMEIRYPREGTRQMSPNEDTSSLKLRHGHLLPIKPEMIAKRHSGREVTSFAANGGLPDVAVMTSGKGYGRTSGFRSQQLENTFTSHTGPSRSGSGMTADRRASNDERHRRISPVNGKSESLHLGVPVGAPSRDGSGATPQVGTNTRRRYSLPAEGSFFSVLRYGVRGTPSSDSVAEGVMSQHDAFSWTGTRAQGGRGKEGLEKKSRRQSADIVRNCQPEADLRFLAQRSASQSVAGEGQPSRTAGEKLRTLPTAFPPPVGFPPDSTPSYSHGGAEVALTAARSATDSERKGRSLARPVEEGNQTVGKDLDAGREQSMTRPQQPLLCTAFREAAHAAAAAARFRTSATTSAEQRTFSGIASTPATGKDVRRVVAESGSLVAASANVGETSTLHLKHAVPAATEPQAGRNITEGSTRDVFSERQLWHREADTRLRTTSGISMASTSDHSSATRASADKQHEQLLLRAKQHRFVGEAAAVAACVTAACVKRVALFPVQRLIANTLQHWQRSVEPIPGENDEVNDAVSQGGQHYPLDTQDTASALHVPATDASLSHRAHQHEEPSPVCGIQSFSKNQAETGARSTLRGIKCVSVPLSALVRSSLPPGSDSTTSWRHRAAQNLTTQHMALESAEQQLYEQDTRCKNDVSCLRVTLFALKQVLRWRHLRQRVALFTEKTSPYYFWPPWGGYRSFIEAGGSELYGEPENFDSDGGGLTSARHVDFEQPVAEGESAGVVGLNSDCGPKEDSGGLNFLESPTSTSRGKKRMASEPQCASQQEMNDGIQSAVSEARSMKTTQSYIADMEFTTATPTKSNPDLEVQFQRRTTATSSSPPILGGETDHGSSPALALAQQKEYYAVNGDSRQKGDGRQESAGSSTSRPVATDSRCAAPPLGSSSPSMPRAPQFQPAGLEKSFVGTSDVSGGASGAAPTVGTCYRTRTDTAWMRLNKREWTLREKTLNADERFCKESGINERSVLQNYKDKHAVVPFLPNVLAAPLTTQATACSTTSPQQDQDQDPLRLPFEEAGTVYVLRDGISDSSPSAQEQVETQASGRSPERAANKSFGRTQETDCRSNASETCTAQESHKTRNACSSLRDTALSSSLFDEKDENRKRSSNRVEGTDLTTFQPTGNIIAVWACTAGCSTFVETSTNPDSEQRSCFSSNDRAGLGQAAQKRFWLSADTLTDVIREEAYHETSTGDIVGRKKEGNQTTKEFQEAVSPPTLTSSEGKSEPEMRSTSSGSNLCGQPAQGNHRTLHRIRHQKKAQEVMEAMQMWCKATSKSDKGRDTSNGGMPDDDAGCLKEVSLESFASSYNNMAEEALKRVLTQIRTRKGRALPPAASQLLEERARIFLRKRKEEVRYVQHQLRRKFQQLVQNFNKLVAAERKQQVQTSSPDRDDTSADASRLSESVNLEEQFQQRLQHLHQRVEYHLHQRRRLATLLMRHKARVGRQRSNSYAGPQPLSGGRWGLRRRRLQWYSVGIRWLRTKAAFEYFVVRHRQRVTRRLQLHSELADVSARPPQRIQKFNAVSVNECDGEQPFYRGMPSESISSPPANNSSSATHVPYYTAEDRSPAGFKRRLSRGQRRGSHSSSGEDWKNFKQCRGQRGVSGAVCGSGRSSVCGDERERGAFYFPTMPPVGPVGMSPVTLSETSTPVTPGSPPLSSNEDGLSGESSKGSVRQQHWGAYSGAHTHTSSVLLLHELLQPLRLDAGGIRAALILVVLRLRRFIRVVRSKERVDNDERRDLEACTNTTSNGNTEMVQQQTHTHADGEMVVTRGREAASFRAQLSRLAKLQSDIMEISTGSAKRSRQGRKQADFITSVTGDISDGRTFADAHPPHFTPPDSAYTGTPFAHRPWADTMPQRNSEPLTGPDEPDEAEERRQADTSSMSLMSRQFPWSSIRMALVLPNFGVQLEQILPPTRLVNGRDHPDPLWRAGVQDRLLRRNTAAFAYPGKFSRYSVYESDTSVRRSAETFAALSQSSQHVDSDSQSPAPRRSVPGAGGVAAGVGDAAEARAARAAARAAAAETRNWRMREREEAEARASGLSDHATYSGEGSGFPGRTERSRGRSSPERIIRRADGEGISEVDGDEEEEENPAGEKTTTNSCAFGRRTGKLGEVDIRYGQAGLTRTPSPHLSQRIRRSYDIPSVTRSEFTAKRKQHWMESDEESHAGNSFGCSLRANALSSFHENDEGDGVPVLPIEGGALEPFWWRACCANFHQRKQSLSDDWKQREPSLKTAQGSTEAVLDEIQQSLELGYDRDATRQLDGKETWVMEDKGRSRIVRGPADQPRPSSGGEAAGYSSRQDNAKKLQRLHGDSRSFNTFKYPAAATPQEMQHMVPSYAPLSASSSESSSSDEEECKPERGTGTTSDSSTWSKPSSTCSDVSVEPPTVLQQLSARQVAAGTALLLRSSKLSRASQVARDMCGPKGRDASQSSVIKTVEAHVRQDNSGITVEPTEQLTDIQAASDTVVAAHSQETEQQSMEDLSSARLPSLLSGTGDADVLHSVECPPEDCLDGSEYSQAGGTKACSTLPSLLGKTNAQLLDAGEDGEKASSDTLLLDQIVAALTPRIIVMPSEEVLATDLPKVLPQLQVRFTTCAVDLTPKDEVQVLQRSVTQERMALRPRRANRRLYEILSPVLHTLQVFSHMEEGRGGLLRGKPSTKLGGGGDLMMHTHNKDGPQLPRSMGVTTDLIYSAVWSAAAELARDAVNPRMKHQVDLVKDQSLRKDGIPDSRLVNAETLTDGRPHEVKISVPREATTLVSRRICRGERLSVDTEGATQTTYDKLRTVIEDAVLYLSGVLDLEIAQVEALKESTEGDALLNLLQFAGDKANARAVLQAPPDGDDAGDRDARGAKLARERLYNGALEPTRAGEAHTGDEAEWHKKKRVKMEVCTQSPPIDMSSREPRRVKRPVVPLKLQDEWGAPGISESLFDFGPKKTSGEDATSKTAMCSPRAFGRRRVGHRLPRRPGLRSKLHVDASAALDSSEKDGGGRGANREDRSSKDLRIPFRFFGGIDEVVTTGRRDLRSRPPLFLRPDDWETADDESGSSSSAEKTSAYAPVSSGSESVYLSVPSSPRRRRQQRQMRWRSRQLAVSATGAYHLTSAELVGEFSAEAVDKSVLDSRKRAYAARTPRRVGVGSVFGIYPGSRSSTGDTVALQPNASSRPSSPPLTRGAAATAPPAAQIYTDAEALPAGQRDVVAKSECTTRERRRTAQQDRQFSRYLPEKLSKHQFAAGSSSQSRRKSNVGRMQRSRAVPVIAAPSLEWSGPECSVTTPTRKNTASDATGLPQPSSKGHILAEGVGHNVPHSEGAALALPATGFSRTGVCAAGRGGASLDSPREPPRPGRRTPTAGSPVPTGVYFDASRRLWRCQWRENGRFKTKGFSLNTYGTLKDARKACIIYRCLMGGWEVDPRWLADNDSQDSGDNGAPESHAPKADDNVSQDTASKAGGQSELEHGEGEVTQCVAPATHCDAAGASERSTPEVTHCAGTDAENSEIVVAGSCDSGPTGSMDSADIRGVPTAEPVASAGPSL